MTKRVAAPLWKTIFASIGIIAAAGLLFNLLVTNLASKAKPFSFSSTLSASDESLLRSLSSLTGSPLYKGGSVTILQNGDFYPSLFADITHAEHSIDMTQYIWENGSVSDSLFALLEQKARADVTVRVIIDAFGSKSIDKDKIKELENAGAHVAWFHPAKIGLLSKFYKRNHARAIVIDNTIAYTGGEAVADYWSGNAEDKNHWHDLMFRITGQSIEHVAHTFSVLWSITTGELLTAPTTVPEEKSPMQTVGITNEAMDQDIESLSLFFGASIRSAEHTLYIETPYLVLEERMKDELCSATGRGVDVRLLLPGTYIDTKIVQAASRYYYSGLLKCGVKIYEYNPTMLHSKFMVADGAWSVIGSANIDTRSAYYNIENNIGVSDTTLAASLEKIFSDDLSQSTEISYQEWRRRSIFRKGAEAIASLFDKQL